MQGHKRVTVNDKLWVRFPFEEVKYLIFSFLCSGVEVKRSEEFHHSMPPEFGRKWGTECLN